MTIACLLRNTLQAARMAVRVSRLRAGEWTAAAGAAALLVTLFLQWFGVEVPAASSGGGPQRAQRRRRARGAAGTRSAG